MIPINNTHNNKTIDNNNNKKHYLTFWMFSPVVGSPVGRYGHLWLHQGWWIQNVVVVLGCLKHGDVDIDHKLVLG
jgi:hypothetical protein